MFKKLFIISFLVMNIFIFSISFEEYEKQTDYKYKGFFTDDLNILVTYLFNNDTYDLHVWDSSDLNNLKSLYKGDNFIDFAVSNNGLKLASVVNDNKMIYVYDFSEKLNYVVLRNTSDIYFHPNGDMVIVKVINGKNSEFHFVNFKKNEDKIIIKYRENKIPFSKDAKMHVFNDTFIISDFKGHQDGYNYDNNYLRKFSEPQKNFLKFKTPSDQVFFNIDNKWIYHFENRLDAVGTEMIYLPQKSSKRIILGNIGKLLYPDLAYIDVRNKTRVSKYFSLKHEIVEITSGEYLLYKDNFVLVNEIHIPDNFNVYAFDRNNNEHVYFSEGEVIRFSSFNTELKEYIDQFFKNLELLNIGFENTVEDIVEIMNMEKMEFLAFNENRFFGDEFNLSYYNKTRLILEELKALITKENPTQFDFNYIYKKIIQYSLLANYTNNHEEAEKAIQYFKDLKSIYPNFINWEEVYKNLVLLEALTISNKQNTKEAYYYILDQEGFLYEEENVLESYIEDYPEMFHELLKDKKKLSYFSGISEGKLTSLENSYSSDKDIIDEKKEIYSFSEFLKNIKPNINNLM